MSIYSQKFIEKNYFLNDYNTAFKNEFAALNDDAQNRFFTLASTRIKRLVDRPFIDLNDLEQEQSDGVKIAVSRMVDYWLEYGLDLNRISGSVSLGSFSASQTAPNDPDYIPENVYEILQDVNLYTPVGLMGSSCNGGDCYDRFDDEQAITYGVRFKALERVKDITIDKLDSEKGNKDLHIPTTKFMNDAITAATLSVRTFRGQFTTGTITDLTTDFDTFLNTNISNVNDGDSAEIKYTGTGSYNGIVEQYIFANNAWTRISSEYEQREQLSAVVQELLTLDSEKVDKTYANARLIATSRTFGNTQMASEYTPSNSYDVITKQYTDIQNNLQDIRITNTEQSLIQKQLAIDTLNTNVATINSKDIQQDSRLTGVEKDILALQGVSGTIQIITAINTWNGSQALTGSGTSATGSIQAIQGDKGAFDFTANKRLNVSLSVEVDGTRRTYDKQVIIGKEIVFGDKGTTGATDLLTITVSIQGNITIVKTGTGTSFNVNTVQINGLEQFNYAAASTLIKQSDLTPISDKANANEAEIATLKTQQTATDKLAQENKTNIASNTTAIATKAAQTAVDNLNVKPVRTIDANGAEIGMSLGAYTTSALDNGLIDKSVLDKRTTIDIATKAEVNTKAPQATTYTKAEVDAAIASAINALPKAPTRKDITATYATRKWNANDAGKKVWITDNMVGTKVGFISEGYETKFINGGAVVDLGIDTTNQGSQTRLYWSTEHVSNVGFLSLETKNIISINETEYNIIKFEIEE